MRGCRRCRAEMKSRLFALQEVRRASSFLDRLAGYRYRKLASYCRRFVSMLYARKNHATRRRQQDVRIDKGNSFTGDIKVPSPSPASNSTRRAPTSFLVIIPVHHEYGSRSQACSTPESIILSQCVSKYSTAPCTLPPVLRSASTFLSNS